MEETSLPTLMLAAVCTMLVSIVWAYIFMTPINEFHITDALECHTENIDLHSVAVNISQYEWDGWPPHIPSTLARAAGFCSL